MALPENTSGAVHLTSLSLDISELQKQVDTVEKEMDELAKKATEAGEKVRQSLGSGLGGTSGGKGGSGAPSSGSGSPENTEKKLSVSIKQIADLQKQYANMAKTIESARINTSEIKGFNDTIKGAREQLSKWREDAKDTGKIVDEEAKAFQKLKLDLTDLQRDFADVATSVTKAQDGFKTGADAVKNLNAQIDKFPKAAGAYADFLKSLDKGKTELSSESEAFKTVRAEAEKLVQGITTLNATVASNKEVTKDNLTSLDGLNQRYNNLKAQLKQFEQEAVATGVGLKQVSSSIKEIPVSKIEDLNLRYKEFLTTLANSKLTDNQLKTIPKDAQDAANEMQELLEKVKGGKINAEELGNAYNRLSSTLKELKGRHEDEKRAVAEEAKQFHDISKVISDTIPKLREFEKTATFKNARAEAAALRAEYKTLADNIKAGNLSVGEAQSQLDNLGQRFNDFANHVKTGNTALQNFVDKISESAKWQIANILINQVRQAFGQLFETITQTEDAVIQLRRVLGSQAPANTAMSDELYNIAYEFGQTFDAVQETAVKFAQTGMDWQETIDATRAAMLALNTAELDTATATDGLIAVMAQFDIEAKDLEAVIDKINITADNFPVTSEKIVQALQRAGSSAANAGLTFEQTIGIITALSEATGRAGANIGTALNSIINFTSKASAIETFEKFLGLSSGTLQGQNPLAIWKALGDAIKADGEALGNMMAQSEEFAELFDADIAEAVGATGQLQEAIEHQEDVWNAAGTYRKNYFIALINNIDRAIKAIEGMNGAIGYSAQENLTAMEAFRKKWQQLIDSLQMLAVQLGESGLLDFMKLLVEATTAVVRFTNSIGGLTTVMLGLTTVFAHVKAQAIHKHFENLELSIKGFVALVKNVPVAFNAFTTALKSGAGASAALSEGLSYIGITALPSMLTGVLAATTVIYAFYSKWKDHQENVRKEIIKTGQEAADSLNAMYEAEKKFRGSSGDDRVEAAKELLNTLGFTQAEIDDISGKLKEQAGNEQAINDIIAERLEMKFQEHKMDQEDAYKTQEKTARESFEVSGFNFGKYAEDRENVAKALKELNISEDEFYKRLRDLDNLEGDVNKKIEDSEIYLKAFNKALNDSGKENSYVYQRLKTTNKALSDYVEQSENGIDMTARQSDSWVEYSGNLKKAEEATNDVAKSVADSNKNVTLDAKTLRGELEELESIYTRLTGKIDSFQSAYNTLKGVVDQYNKNGGMTADMLQTLLGLSPEYIELLDIEGDKLSINEDRLQDLMEANSDYMIQLAAMKISKETDAFVTDLLTIATEGLTEEEINAKLRMMELKGEVANAAYEFFTGKGSANKLKTAIAGVGEQAGLTGGAIETLVNRIMGLTTSTKQFLNTANLAEEMAALPDLQKRPDETGTEFNERRRNELAKQQKKLEEAQKKLENTNKTFWFGSSSAKSSGGGSSSTKKTAADVLNEKAQNAINSLKEMMEVYEHTIDLIGRNRGDAEKLKNVPFFSDFGGKGENYIESQVAIYREMQKQTHELANQFREMGFGEESEYIRELQELHWSYHDAIIDLYQDMYDQQIGEHENMIDELSYQYDQLEKAQDFSGMTDNLSKQIGEQKAIQEAALKEYTKLLEVGVDKNDDAVQSALKTIRDAANEIQAINDKIKENVLGAYDDFISAADKFDLWDNLDFTKVDYLQRKMQAINQLFRDGTITLQEYNNQLREMTEAMYDAQIEQFQKEQEETQKYYDDLIDKRKEDIEALKKQKDETKDYYDTIIDGYKEEIKQWENRKDEVTEYYDELIDALNEVQEDNDRINRQIDYYNSRQKIITNLEQAQARSGVEWREKEMEYQQQLIELDEEWNRTRQEWSIADQIEELNKLRDAALADIDASIEKINENIEVVEQQSTNAINNIEGEIASIEDVIDDLEKQSEAAIDRIEERIKELSKQIADAFSSASMNGMMNTTQAINNAFANAGSKLFGGGMTNLGTSLSGYGSGLTSSLVNSAQTASKKALETLKTNFVNPALPLFGTLGVALGTALSTGIKNANIGSNTRTLLSSGKGLSSSIRNIMNSATAPTSSNISSIMARNTSLANAATNSLKTGSGNATIYVTNNVNSVDSAADKTNNIIQNLGI